MQTTAAFRLLPSGSPPEDGPPTARAVGKFQAEQDELPYMVELWDEAKRTVEQVLAVTSSGSIGYAAYYAATREYVDRYVTLRHKNNIISRWNGPTH
jgi:hypothetical protein